MDDQQAQFERTVGDAFIEWYNNSIGVSFEFSARPENAPDLHYEDGANQLVLEITGAYYDSLDATLRWQNLRKVANAPTGWGGKDMDESLLDDISTRIRKKCRNRYGADCILVIYVHPAMTLKEEVDELLRRIEIPHDSPFAGIYLTGHFPHSTTSWGGYMCWKLA
ncbi:MAG: hypothetical protein V3U60_17080 [Gammaproteobacteria bacterium]